MNLKDWLQIAGYIVPLVLAQHPKTRPIANEVSDAVARAEQLPGATGQEKLATVVAVAKDAAQAVDELRGHEDETAGVARDIVDAAVPLVNAIAKHTPKGSAGQ